MSSAEAHAGHTSRAEKSAHLSVDVLELVPHQMTVNPPDHGVGRMAESAGDVNHGDPQREHDGAVKMTQIVESEGLDFKRLLQTAEALGDDVRRKTDHRIAGRTVQLLDPLADRLGLRQCASAGLCLRRLYLPFAVGVDDDGLIDPDDATRDV